MPVVAAVVVVVGWVGPRFAIVVGLLCGGALLAAVGVVGGLLFILFFLIVERLVCLCSLLVDLKLFALTSLLDSGSFGVGGFLAAQGFPNRPYVVMKGAFNFAPVCLCKLF